MMDMTHRLFVAINLSNQVKKEIVKLREELEIAFDPEMLRQVRFTPPENWHLTVSFLGHEDDAELPNIVRAMEAAAKHFHPQELSFDRILYGPPRRGTKRMIWISASEAASQSVSLIKEFFEDRLAEANVPFSRETRHFSGHITLARFNGEIPNGALPGIERPLHLRSPVESLDLMESTLHPGGVRVYCSPKTSICDII